LSETSDLNESHRRRLLVNAQYADRLLSDVEAILSASESKSPFPKYRPDVSLHEARLIRSHIARFRDHLSRVLPAVGVESDGARFGSLHSIQVTLSFVRVAVAEMAPEYLRGYGELSDRSASELRGLSVELEGLIDSLDRNLALGAAVDLQARLERLQRTTKEADLLRLLDRIINEDELAEFRAALLNLVEKVESPRFEIAVFGRVSSGKSSLLNHVLGTDILPVGVNPITAVPTRLVFGHDAGLAVTFADRQVRCCPIEDLVEYASEERNPGNKFGVSKLVVTLPSPRLQEGLVLVDTPGLGALATAGAAETLSYLPQCDLGIVLISAVNPINEEDLSTIHALARAGIPVMGLLSKVDLLSRADLEKALAYTKDEVRAHLGLAIELHPVSTMAGNEEMLEEWFGGSMAPLFERHQEQAQRSIRRKAGVLRDEVIAALNSKLDEAGTIAPATPNPLEEIERRLRTSAGEIEVAHQFCLAATNDVRSLDEVAIQRSAQAIVGSWNGQRSASASGAKIIRYAAERLAAEAATPISARLTALAHHLQSALALATEALHDQSSPQDDELEGCVREMPRFEAMLPVLDIDPPWFRSVAGITRRWVTRTLRHNIATGLQRAFENYGRTLEAWIRQVLAELQRRFDARADGYRAQLARLMSHKAPSDEERATMERHLAELAELGETEARMELPA
jgi:GTP-binding protein EngB required for normal cell division